MSSLRAGCLFQTLSRDLYQNLSQMVGTRLQIYKLISELRTPVMSRVLQVVASIFNAARRVIARVP